MTRSMVLMEVLDIILQSMAQGGQNYYVNGAGS